MKKNVGGFMSSEQVRLFEDFLNKNLLFHIFEWKNINFHFFKKYYWVNFLTNLRWAMPLRLW